MTGFFKPVLTELIRKVDDAIYTTVAPFSISGWLTQEPVNFAARESGRAFTPRLGEAWSERLFDCAWMRFRAELPPGAATGDPLVARIDISGELCLVDDAGVPVRGLTTIKSNYDPRLGSPAKTIYRLPPALLARRTVELWGDAGCNDLFGVVQNGGRVVLAEIARCREDLRDLYYDLETLRHYRESGAVPANLAEQLEADLATVARTLDCQNRASVAAARSRLAAWFRSSAKPELRVSAVGHAHMDLAWLWPIRETIRKGARTFSSVLYNLERFPEYIFGASQPQLYAWMKEHYPELYVRIKQAVARGQIEPQGVFWVEVDCNIPNGESFVRQILHGARFFREEFGIEPRYCWEPDVFGYHGQLPQILKRSGLEVFMTQKISWNVVNRFPLQSFHWAGIDGTEILAHLLPEETYNGPASAYSLKKIGDEYAQRDVSHHALMVFGIGDGGGGPDAEHLERLRRAPGLPGLPVTVVEPAAEFFRKFMPEAGRFPRHQGELYLERHQGTLTTQAQMKRFNRQGELALREVEWACFLACIHGGRAYPTEELDRIWKEVLLYQFHDILPGSSIKRVYDECYVRYAQIMARLAAMQAEAYQSLPGSGAAGRSMVFNSLAWARDEWLKCDGAWRRVHVPAFGSALCPAAAGEFGAVRADKAGLENEHLTVTFGADGTIASIRDRESGREYVAAGETVNQFVAIQDIGDAWDFETDYERKDVWKYLSRPVTRPKLVQATAAVDGPCATVVQEWTVGHSRIRQTISLKAGSDRLEFATQVDWQDTGCMLRVRFPVAVVAEEATFEIPFGHIRRSTREDTLVQRAQIEVAAQQWVDLSGADAGVALLNDCKYGHRVKGHTLDLCLIRSVPHPNINTAGRLTGTDVSRDEFTDLGAHEFRYALVPHAGPFDPVRITRAARCFNSPLACGPKVDPAAAPLQPVLRLGHAAIELAAVKRAETGTGWALRLANVSADPVETGLALNLGEGTLTECDLMERPIGSVIPAQVEQRVKFAPFEIKTFAWRPA